MKPDWTSGAATDIGLLRERNEDRYWVDAEHGAFLVVDGLGGHAAGELAAQTAVDAIRESLSMSGPPVEERVRAAITAANNRIFERSSEGPEFAGMACVLTLAVVEEDEITIGHVGDSRLYLVWNGAIRKLTSDHSPVGEVEDSGELTESEAMRHPRRNEVFRDVGSRLRAPDDPEFIEIRRCRFRPDAALLLCSDGLTDQLTSRQVREIVEGYRGDPEHVAAALVEAANAAGGRDNATALFVAGRDFCGGSDGSGARVTRAGEITAVRESPPPEKSARIPRLLTGRIAFLTYGVLLGMLLWAVLHGGNR